MPKLRSDQFTFHKDANTFTAEISDFYPFNLNIQEDIYIESVRTGVTKLFFFTGTTKNNEDEIVSFNYTSQGLDDNRRRMYLKLWND